MSSQILQSYLLHQPYELKSYGVIPAEGSFSDTKTFSSIWFGMTIGDTIGENDPSCDKKPIYGTGKPILTEWIIDQFCVNAIR